MADDSTEKLLLAFGLDLSPVKEAVKGIQSMLGSLNTMAEGLDQKSQAAAATAKETATAIKTEASAAVKTALEAISAETQKLAATKAATQELKQQTAQHQANVAASREETAAAQAKRAATVAETAELVRQKAEHAAITAEITKQMAEMRRERLEQSREGRESREGAPGGAGGLIEKITGGILGKGIAGSVAGGLLAGEGIVAVIEGAGAAIEHFIDKLKEVSIESGNIVALQKVFDGLAKGAGVDATKMMENLSDASEGLVSQLTLLKVATTALRSPYKITSDVVTQLTHDVTILSEASGNTAERGLQSLNQALERGRPMTLGLVTGLAGLRDVMRDIPPAATPAERSMIQWQRAIKMIHDQALAIGDLPDTFEKFSTRMKVAAENATLEFGKAFNESPGIQQFFKQAGGIQKLFESMTAVAHEAGTAIGAVFGVIGNAAQFVADNMSTIKKVLQDIIGLGAGVLFALMAEKIMDVGKASLIAARDIDLAKIATVGWKDALNGLKVVAAGLVTTLLALSGYAFYKGITGYKDALSAGEHETVKWSDMLGALKLQLQSFFNPADITSTMMGFHQALQQVIAARHEAEKMASFTKVTGMETGGFATPEAAAASQFGLSGGIKPPPGMDQETLQQRERSAQMEMQEQIAHNKEMYDAQMAAITERKQADEQSYRDGEEELRAHYMIQKNLVVEGYQDQLDMINKNTEEQLEQEQKKYDLGIEAKDVYEKAILKIQSSAQDQLVKATEQANKQLDALTDQEDRDRQTALKKQVEARSQIQLQEVQARSEFELKGMQGGSQSVDDYYQKQIGYLTQIRDIKVRTAQDVAALTPAGPANDAQRMAAEAAALEELQKKVQDLWEQRGQMMFQSIQKQFQPQQQLLQQQIAYGQSVAAAGQGPEPTAQLQQMVDLVTKYREQLEAAAQAMIQQSRDTGLPLDVDLWNQMLDKIEQSYQMQQQYNEQLQKMQDILQPISSLVSTIGRSISGIFGGSTGNIGQMLSAAGQSMAGMQKQVFGVFNAFGVKTPTAPVQKDSQTLELEQRAKDLMNPLSQTSQLVIGSFDKLNQSIMDVINGMQTWKQALTGEASPASAGGTISGMGTGTGQPVSVGGAAETQGSFNSSGQFTSGGGSGGGGSSVGDTTQKFATGLASAVSALSSFIDSIGKASSAVSGGMSGGMSGMGIGNSLDQMFKGLGPWGAIGGAAIGAVAGIFTGSKNEQMRDNITQLEQQFSQIMNQFNQNTNNLQQAIGQIQGLIGEAQAMQASSKKGGQQYQNLINQYNQQLQSLEDQQAQIIRNMQTQLAILQTPLAGQSYLNSVEQLLQQYQQFVGAAQNAEQLAQANEFLASSLQNLATSYTQQLLQNESQAVQDALQLNTLYQQRLLYINQLNTQIQGVLEQGSLTRQQTMAQKKGQQIEQIQAGANIQLDQMNQEIALQQMKVSAESRVFSLATTRIGLETQLLQLQGAQTSYQMAQIAAMQQLVNTLQAGNFNFQTLQALLNALGFTGAAGTVPINTTVYGGPGGSNPGLPSVPGPGGYIPAQSPLGMTSTANAGSAMSGVEALFASAYAERGAIGYGNYRGQNL